MAMSISVLKHLHVYSYIELSGFKPNWFWFERDKIYFSCYKHNIFQGSMTAAAAFS